MEKEQKQELGWRVSVLPIPAFHLYTVPSIPILVSVLFPSLHLRIKFLLLVYYESADMFSAKYFLLMMIFFSSHLQPFLASPTSFILKINFLSITFNFLKSQGLNWGKNMYNNSHIQNITTECPIPMKLVT